MATEQTVPQVLGNTPKPPVPEPGTAFPPSKGPPPEPVGPPQEAE